MNMKSPKVGQFFQSFTTIFQPPFAGLWLVVVLYVVWSHVVVPGSNLLRGNLPDTDDYMYLTQVLDWLQGQGWYDNIQHRLDPPFGTPIHFSRLAQIPMAALILGFEALGLKPHGAAFLTAVFEPIFLFGYFLIALRWLGAHFLPREKAGVTAIIVLFATGTLFLYAPGHLDHHGLVLLLMTFQLGCLVRLFQYPEKLRYAVLAGALMALALIVALEVLPWLLIIATWVGLWAIIGGAKTARAGALYALILYLGSVVGLLLTRSPAMLFANDVLTYSLVYVELTGGIAVCFAGILLSANYRKIIRFVIAGAVALGTGVWFLQSFPDLLAGPYGAMDPALAQMILGEMDESKPLFGPGITAVEFFGSVPFLAIAILAALIVWRKKSRQFFARGLIFILLLAATALSIFYQRRFLGFAGTVATIPLAIFLFEGLEWIGRTFEGRGKFFAEFALILLVAPFPGVFLPALVDGRTFNKGVLLFPAQSEGNLCDMFQLENILRDPKFYGDHPRLILNMIGSGPEILFRTSHRVLSAPYHMDVEGNLDATRFLSTIYPEEAEAIVRRRGVELIVACRMVPDFYIHPARDQPHENYKFVPDIAPRMVERLMSGHVPPWLKRIKFKDLDNYVIYEVQPHETMITPSAP